MARRRLIDNYLPFRIKGRPSERSELPIADADNEMVTTLESSDINTSQQLHEFRTLSEDRQTMYSSYDEMKTDSIIAAALELYADDATQYDEQGRVIWVESDDNIIADAGNRLLDLFEIPERAWKHIYQACLYGDYYLKLYREGDFDDEDLVDKVSHSTQTRIVNDRKEIDGKVQIPPYEEYVEDVEDPAMMFDLRKRGKTAGFIEITKEVYQNSMNSLLRAGMTFQMKDLQVYRPDRFIHIMMGENLSRNPETITIDLGDSKQITYTSARGKSILQDVYPTQRELQLLEDALLLNRLTRSSLIRLLEIELGNMPKNEVNTYMRRIKGLIEQHISIDKTTGNYQSYNAPGPIDNVVYIPVCNGKGSISVNNLGGDVNVRDIADIDYFNNKRAGALKIPRAYLGDDMDGSGLSNGGSLTRLSIRYARTVKRIQTSYIRAITTLLNLFFIDKKLDYVNKFTVRMTSPSTQEDLERNELIAGNVDLISSIMDLLSSLGGDTQKKVLNHLVSQVLKMPEIAKMIKEDKTPEEEIDIEGGPVSGGPSFDSEISPDEDLSSSDDTSSPTDTGDVFTDEEFAEFQDDIGQ